MNIPQPNMTGNIGGNPNQVNLNITLDKTEPTTCEKCHNDIFLMGLMFRKVSRFITGTDKDSIIPIEVYICSKCNEPLEETIPTALRNPKISV